MGSVADWTDLHSRFMALAESWMHRTAATCAWVRAVDGFLKQFIMARSGEWLECSENGGHAAMRGVLLCRWWLPSSVYCHRFVSLTASRLQAKSMPRGGSHCSHTTAPRVAALVRASQATSTRCSRGRTQLRLTPLRLHQRRVWCGVAWRNRSARFQAA